MLSAIVITKNEEANIEECLKSCDFADEKIVVDSGSDDRTVELARRFSACVYAMPWLGYAGAKQYALERAAGEWILWLDADERVTKPLAEEIRSVVGHPTPHAAFRMKRKAYFLGRWMRHGGWYPGYVIRLFRKDLGRFGKEKVHERIAVEGPVGTLQGHIDHHTDPSIDHYLEKLNRYTSLAAEDGFERGRRISLAGCVVRSAAMFFKMYVFRRGFLDGTEGFLLAVFSSFHVFSKYAKLWEMKSGSDHG